MTDTLDELTNDQLRLRLLEYGMANMPVTTTTRKVLIKRLRTVLDGKPTSTPRRETIHVARFSSGDESEPDASSKSPSRRANTKAPSVEKSNRRATIGIANNSTGTSKREEVAAPAPAAPKPISTRRSSARQTPTADTAVAAKPAPIARAPEVVTLAEDSDDDIEFVPVVVAPTRASPSRRVSRSPSMGKSETVVTSYKQVKAPAPIAEDQYDDDDEQNADTSGDAEVSSINLGRSTADASPINKTSPAKTAARQYFSSSKSSSTTTTTTSYRAPAAVQYQSPSEHLNRSAGRTGTHWQHAPATPPRVAAAVADDLIVSDASTPYLSDFTRRLSRLRAEPLLTDGRGDATASTATSPTSYRTATRRRESTDQQQQHDEFRSPASMAYRTSTRLHGRPTLASQQAPAAVPSSYSLVQRAQWAIGRFEQRFRYQIWGVVLVLLGLFVFAMLFT